MFCMKPHALFLVVSITVPAVLTAISGLPGHSNLTRYQQISPADSTSSQLIASAETSLFWAKVKYDITLESLAQQTDISADRLAQLNDTDTNRKFYAQEWVAFPSKSQDSLRLAAAVDDSELRRSQPQRSIIAKVGDNLAKIAHRYEIPVSDLARLNPGLNPIARIAVDTPIRLLQPVRARIPFAITPSGSGGLSWPQLPDFGNQPNQRSFSGFIWPAAGTLTSGYGWRWGRMHRGIDVANNVGTPIIAVADGVVISSGWNDGGYGYLVEVAHIDGTITRYAHNSRLLVSKGMEISQGSPLALMGSTGRSTGPHLHFEIIPPNTGAVNPLAYLPRK
jgi:murein DD-endopeptidase MepM/ murein hydrolase activator NlpD